MIKMNNNMTKNLGEGSIPKLLAGLAILAVGAMTIITSTSQLVLMPLQGICQGGQPIISFNISKSVSMRRYNRY